MANALLCEGGVIAQGRRVAFQERPYFAVEAIGIADGISLDDTSNYTPSETAAIDNDIHGAASNSIPTATEGATITNV